MKRNGGWYIWFIFAAIFLIYSLFFRSIVAVVVAFFLCWAPFHAQRLMAVYGKTTKTENDLFRNIYTVLTYVSGVLYFMSTCINPLLYSIMSHKFRDAFKVSIQHYIYSVLCLHVASQRSKKMQIWKNVFKKTHRKIVLH